MQWQLNLKANVTELHCKGVPISGKCQVSHHSGMDQNWLLLYCMLPNTVISIVMHTGFVNGPKHEKHGPSTVQKTQNATWRSEHRYCLFSYLLLQSYSSFLSSKHQIVLDYLTAKTAASSGRLEIYKLISPLYFLLYSEQAVLWQTVTRSKQGEIINSYYGECKPECSFKRVFDNIVDWNRQAGWYSRQQFSLSASKGKLVKGSNSMSDKYCWQCVTKDMRAIHSKKTSYSNLSYRRQWALLCC